MVAKTPLDGHRTRLFTPPYMLRNVLRLATQSIVLLLLPLMPLRAQLTVSAKSADMIDPARCVADCFEATHAYSAPAYVSKDVARTTTLLYRSGRASPVATVHVWARHPDAPAGSRFRIQAYRGDDGTLLTWTSQSTELHFWPEAGNDSTMLTGRIDASGWGTGRHVITIIVNTIGPDGTQIAQQLAFVGVITVDGRNSDFGTGVDLVGYQRLYFQSAGDGYLVTDGSGAASFFHSSQSCSVYSTCTFSSPYGDFSVLSTDGTGYYTRRYPDGTNYRFHSDGHLYDVIDRFGIRTTYTHSFNADAADGTVLTGITDPAGQTTSFVYWPGGSYWKPGRIAEIHAPGGRFTVYAIRPENNNLDHYRDPNWNLVALLQYDGANRLTQVTDANGGVWDYGYSSGGYLARVEAPSVSVSVSGGSQAHRPTSSQVPFGGSILDEIAQGYGTWQDPVRNTVDVRAVLRDPRLNATYLTLNEFGSPLAAIDPLGQTSYAAYDGAGLLTRSQSASGRVVGYVWNQSRLRQVHDSSMTKQASWNPVRSIYIDYGTYDQPTRIYGHTTEQCLQYRTTQAGHPLQYSRIGSCTAPATTYTYRADGRLASVADPQGHTTSYGYSAYGMQNQTSVTRPGARTTSFAHDAFGRTMSTTDARGYARSTQFDPLNRASFTVGPEQDTTHFQYDALGNVTRVTDAKGQYYQFDRNVLGWVMAQLDASPSHLADQFAYDSAGNVRTRTNRRGQTVRFSYDALNRVQSQVQDAEGGAQTTFAYDPAGRWMTAQNGEGLDTVYYDVLGRVSREAGNRPGLGVRAVTNYFEEPWGDRNRICAGEQSWCSTNIYFEYDQARRLNRISTPSGYWTTVGVDSDELPTSIGFYGGPTVTTSFSELHGLSTTQYSVPAINGAFYRQYHEDQIGQVSRKQYAGNRRHDFSYTSGGRLGGFSDYEEDQYWYCEPGGGELEGNCYWVANNTLLASAMYTFDKVGNRTDAGASLDDPANRTAVLDGFQMTYDADGNITRKYKAGVADWWYQWNSLGQLVNVHKDGAHVAQMGYDGLGRRVRKWTPAAGNRYYLWDGAQVAAELDASGNQAVTYTYYPGIDQLHSVTTGGQTYHALLERVGGNVVGLLRQSDKAVVAQYEYWPWGGLRQDNQAVPNGMRWQGLQYDPETELYYARNRYYDPTIGRFVSEDPIGPEGGINLYAFGNNDPVNSRDPLGLEPCKPGEYQHQEKSENAMEVIIHGCRDLRSGHNPNPSARGGTIRLSGDGGGSGGGGNAALNLGKEAIGCMASGAAIGIAAAADYTGASTVSKLATVGYAASVNWMTLSFWQAASAMNGLSTTYFSRNVSRYLSARVAIGMMSQGPGAVSLYPPVGTPQEGGDDFEMFMFMKAIKMTRPLCPRGL